MIKNFFVLWIWYGSGNAQTIAIDHYATKAECEAAKTAIIYYYDGKDSWNGSTLNKYLVCLEATVKE